MKVRTRIAAIYGAIVGAVLAMLAPSAAFAAANPDGIDTLAPFSTAGGPANWVAIAIVMAVLLVIVLAVSMWISSLFKKSN